MSKVLCEDKNGLLQFGDYTLSSKTKESGFEYKGDIYKVKTFQEITKLEKNEMFAYESVPGTTVTAYCAEENKISFCVEGTSDTQIIVAVEEGTAYKMEVNGEEFVSYDSSLNGKLVFRLALEEGLKTVVISK